MNLNYLQAAKARVPNIPVLVNLVSRRVRQLNVGHRPLVKPDSPNMDRLDLVLKEVAEGKLDVEMLAVSKAQLTEPDAFRNLFND